MRVALLGHTGFVGSAVYSKLKEEHEVTGINSSSAFFLQDDFDVIVNCAGFSSKYKAELQPVTSAEVETCILNYLANEINSDKLIHISSVDAVEDSHYGYLKYTMESKVKKYFSTCLILRLGGVVGPNLKKNVVFDLQERRKVYLTKDSILNFISTKKIAEVISQLVAKKRFTTGKINLIASEGIRVEEIANYLHYIPEWGENKQDYSYLDSTLAKLFWNVGTSKEYVLEYLNENRSCKSS